MTDKEIIKALECCITTNKKYKCEDCPYRKILGLCFDKLNKDAIDLINRQQAEIEELKHEIEVLLEDIHHSADQINEQIEEIERLTINMNAFGLGMKQEKERADTIRAEAIKECLNWVLSLFPEDKNFTTISRFTVNQKIKEMVGEK